jgi:hypothetical protein
VIQTQYIANGKNGELPLIMGHAINYVVESLSFADVDIIKRNGIPILTSLIEYSNEYEKEYISAFKIVKDNEPVFKNHEHQTFISYDPEAEVWGARRIIKRNDETCDEEIKEWVMRPASGKENIQQFYRSNGKMFSKK